MNQKFNLTVGVAALAIVSFVGLRDTGVFVADHQTTLYSGNKLSFQVEEKANIIENKENGYLVQKGQAKVTVPKNKILITEGSVQKYTVKENSTIRKDGRILRNLFLNEELETIEIKDNTIVVKTNDGLIGEVSKKAVKAVEGPYITNAKATNDVVLENENGKYSLVKGQDVKVVSFSEGKFVLINGEGKTFSIEPGYLDFGENGIKFQASQQAQIIENTAQASAVEYKMDVETAPNVDQASAQVVIDSAYAKMGSPYIWGATGENGGYDCSGLVYSIYSNEMGISLPRTSSAQSKFGKQISRDQLQAGDLVFFNTSGSGVSHVGIYIGDDVFIHASSGSKQVKQNKLTDKYYNQRYVNATRVL